MSNSSKTRVNDPRFRRSRIVTPYITCAMPPTGAGLDQTSALLSEILDDFHVRAHVGKMRSTPVGVTFEIVLESEAKVSRLEALTRDIEREMAALSVSVSRLPNRSMVEVAVVIRRYLPRLTADCSAGSVIDQRALNLEPAS